MSKELSPSASLFNRVSELIYGARGRVVSSVNSELVRLYWNIGKVIREEILRDERAEYGAKTIETLAKELVAEYGNSYSKRNLQYMVRFYDVFPDEEIVNAASSQLSWTHFRSLFSIDVPLKRDFYMTLCINERWSVRELNGRIGTMLYERTTLSKKPEKSTAQRTKSG